MTYVHNSCYFRLGLITCGRGTGPSQERLGPRPEPFQKAKVSRTVRGVTSARTSRCNATITTDVISPNLQLLSLGTTIAEVVLFTFHFISATFS